MHKIFFWLPNLKKMILFGGRSGSCVSGDEKAKSGSYGALDATMTYSTLCHVQWLQNVIRKKRGPAAQLLNF